MKLKKKDCSETRTHDPAEVHRVSRGDYPSDKTAKRLRSETLRAIRRK